MPFRAILSTVVVALSAEAAVADIAVRRPGKSAPDVAVLQNGRYAAPAVAQTSEVPQVTEIAANSGYDAWLAAFHGRAVSQGISEATLQRAFAGATYLPDVVKKDRNQSEFTKTLWDYLDSAASDARVNNGKDALRKHAKTLDAIEAKYGVEKEVVAAIWGLESAYGTFRGDIDIISALSTLAFDGRRGQFFEGQLVAALKILQAGDVAPRNMTGSWAGAMGHTQFIPTSYLDYAVDFTGDGRRDIWGDDPSDALASTAAYLARFGWVKGMPWGVEVKLPEGFDYTQSNRRIEKMPSDWARMGITDISGHAVRDFGAASILLPAGAQGAAFMIFKNFSVIERYNTADAYVIGVGHLSDRLKGGPKIQSDWPRGDRALTFVERQEMQERLTDAGFSTKGIDGRIGPNTIDAVRDYQLSKGLIPDGYPSLMLLERLR
ncbi:lytic murein transglycosylase [Donghicola sp. C2-DW-16]|uniref:Lytic murein transglycosylase n=1 Tax=Donghicola mangrovi TaxID=2729614 RepID=A0ABX2PAZ4_9RHOB|nr:lytic murein transglycosylase [Donghicola mangrovi]NVO26281.1 lytic murein transglycosylase [Donghicola mangrovi]